MLLEVVKKSLRINNVVFDDEIQDLIDSAKADLMLSGVSPTKVEVVNDPLIRRAIIIYCKANFGFDNPDSERLQQSYNMLKQHLTLAGDYNALV